MNFYKAQDEAHKKTKILVFYYTLAVFGTVLAMHTAFSFIRFQFLTQTLLEGSDQSEGDISYLDAFLDPQGTALVAGATVLVIVSGWLYKRMQVSGGGGSVAMALGGRLVDPDTRDPEEKQLLNIVEEMAISSGLPVPQVWVMDQDEGINAFAAGTEPGNAVVGVTRGTMQRLNRAELQGVIAHEFSHILNGDMRMNIRLMCMLHGLLLISIIGYSVVRMAFYSGGTHRRRNSKDNNAGMALVAVGISMIIVGTVGAFFAAMIQAAISRQREYLADASAVEFTMDPSGISGALKKIGGSSLRGKVSSPMASEMEHMFFASSGLFNYGMASHPPLQERIELLEPSWDGEFKSSDVRSAQEQADLRNNNKKQMPTGMDVFGAVIAGAALNQEMGESSNTQVQKGQRIVAGLESEWVDACHDKNEAQLLVFGMLMAVDGSLQREESIHLKSAIGAEMAKISVGWQSKLKDIHSSKKIALVDLCIPSLRRLSSLEYEKFIKLTKYLISSDKSVDLFEFMLQKVLQRHLDSHFVGYTQPSVKFNKVEPIKSSANVILSTICGVGAKSKVDLQDAYKKAVQELSQGKVLSLNVLPPNECGMDKIEEALSYLDQASPLVKQQLLSACRIAVMNDNEVTSREVELLRATADALGCTIPPFI